MLVSQTIGFFCLVHHSPKVGLEVGVFSSGSGPFPFLIHTFQTVAKTS